MRLLSVALHEKAEAPALPRGSALQKAPRVGGLVCLADAVRAMDESAGAEKAGIENEAADTKNHVQLRERSEETIYDRRELTEGELVWRNQ